MFKAVVFAALLALAVAAPAPAPGIVTSYSGVVSPVSAYSVPGVSAYSTYGAAPVVSSYGYRPVSYSGYGYGGVPLTYY